MPKIKKTTMTDLLAGSERATQVIEVGEHSITVGELSGRERFALAEKADDNRWDVMVWMCMKGMIDPVPESESDLEAMKPEWVLKIAQAIMNMSGVTDDSLEESENESANVIGIGTS